MALSTAQDASPYNQLLPRPLKSGLYSAVGDGNLIPWALRALSVIFTPSRHIVWVDAANQFNAHWVAQSARAFHKEPKDVLSSFHYARPFTAFQLETMVTEKLLPAANQHNALFAVIADPLSLYAHAEDQSYSITRSFELFTQGLTFLSTQMAILLLMPSPQETIYYRKLLKISDRVVRPNLLPH